MKRNIILIGMIVLLTSCQNNQQPEVPAITATFQAAETAAEENKSVWSVYHPDPDHPWNRLFRQLYRRTSRDGTEYGFDELDPLLWLDTIHLLEGPSHEQAIRALDEFLSARAETLIREPLRRAMFQRDLWAVFDWLASQTEPHPAQRGALERRLAQIIQRVALSRDEIAALPDNYALEVKARTFPADVPVDQPEIAFLPSDLFLPDSAWVPMGREGGPVAMTHTEAFPFFGRSVFLIFVRSPGGRAGTLDFIQSLKTEPNPVTATGSDVALVRRMLLIDDQGEIMLSPLIETVQVRYFSPAQSFHEFELDRERLLAGAGGGLVRKTDLFMLFMGHGDVFENPVPELRAEIPEICKACHFEYPPIPNSGSTRSIISYSRQPFSLPDHQQPVLFVTSLMDEARTVVEWKWEHMTWKSLEALWATVSP